MVHEIDVLRVAVIRERTLSIEGDKQIREAADAARIASAYIGDQDREHFIVLLLNTKHHVTGIHTVSIGSLDASIVHPREVFKPAIVGSASAIIVAHNHPSGDPTPSPEDRSVTQRLNEAGKVLGIDVLDHIVVTNEAWTYRSLKAEGAF